MSQQPPGTFLPNTKVTVGSHKVYIEKYLSEGGFAHVYVVRIPRDNHKHEVAVLKRVAVPDKEHLANMRTEVETMKKLKGHKHIVTYYDSHASQLKGGGYEVFLLMEFCSGGGLIDFMNTRLQHRLTEPEILKIFGDVAEGVATMHYLKPPLLHRDLKVENVLISQSSAGMPVYKVCDFGSTAPPRPAAKTVEEGRLIEEDIQKHTTIQYRSPEMIDVWRKHPIDEKSDIWALGVLLYKLCYYTTPFEDVGQMAILNASFKFPTYPQFSDRLRKLISWMLKEDPRNRPNIYEVVKEVCSMRGTELPIKDIYANRTQSEVRRNESLPSPEPPLSAASIGLQKTTPQVQVQKIPDIAPMRRGRPTAPSDQVSTAAKPASSPARGDPFAALDSKNYNVRAGAVDELSKKFPSLDEFSIVHDGGKFDFSGSSSPPTQKTPQPGTSLNERVTNALADEVFSRSASQTPKVPPKDNPPAHSAKAPQVKTLPVREPEVPGIKAQRPNVSSSAPSYKSTGTGTSPPLTITKKPPEVNNRPIWRVPQHDRSTSQPRASEEAQAAAALLQPSLPPSQRPALLALHRSKSQTSTDVAPAPSRPSGGPQPAMKEVFDSGLVRSGSVNTHARPSSMYVSSNMDFLRDQESSRKRPSLEVRRHHRQHSKSRDSGTDDGNISDDMEFLRNTEENDSDRKRPSRPSHHRKHSGFNALSGAKNIITGRFGDAFKRFEHHHTGDKKDQALAPRTPEPPEMDDPQLLSPIAGSEATQSRHSDMEYAVDETEDLPPEVRRELERNRLSQEEKRVAEAAAEHRARVAAQGPGMTIAPSKANMIQDRVQSLLDERRDAPAPRRTAEGYGKYTEPPDAGSRLPSRSGVPAADGGNISGNGKATGVNPSSAPTFARTEQPRQAADTSVPRVSPSPLPSQTQEAPLQRVISRPSAPPKPQGLRTGGRSAWPPTQAPEVEKSLPARPSGLAALLAKDLEGVPDYPPSTANPAQLSKTSSAVPVSNDDLEADFSKRYPSLSGIEMVETEIKGSGSSATRVKEM